MGRRQSEDDDTMPAEKVKHPLTKEEIEQRKTEFGEVSLRYLDQRGKKTLTNQKANVKLKELESRMHELADSINNGFEYIDAQMKLGEAVKSRQGVVRSVQPPAP